MEGSLGPWRALERESGAEQWPGGGAEGSRLGAATGLRKGKPCGCGSVGARLRREGSRAGLGAILWDPQISAVLLRGQEWGLEECGGCRRKGAPARAGPSGGRARSHLCGSPATGAPREGTREAAHRPGDSWEREDEEMRKRKSLQRAREGPRLSAERSPPLWGACVSLGGLEGHGEQRGARRLPRLSWASPPLQLPKEFPWGRHVHLSLGKKALWDRV